ncbi:MAG: L-lactate dehydrogenase complex protein LldG [Aliidongia sp.]|jgi:L-lactate dehydrogenase complex protein LldG|nr:L-lactate dehydrogenase complex protein LldG [Aliidongia sp.]
MDARNQILSGIRRALKRDAVTGVAEAALARRLSAPQRNLIPARTALDAAGRLALFERMASAVQTTITRVAGPDAVPGAVAQYLADNNLPAELAMAPDRALDTYPWATQPLLTIRRGKAEDRDAVSVTGAFAGIAETGTLMLASGANSPTTLNFLPDTHIVVLRADQIVGPYEEAWDRLRAHGGRIPPRTVNFITGPSRTGDIEQRIQLGAHGPRRLHIVLVEEPPSPP